VGVRKEVLFDLDDAPNLG